MPDSPLVATGNVLIAPNFTAVARGVFVESTPYKQTVYLRNFFGVFVSQDRFISLGFSERLPNHGVGKAGDFFPGTVEQITADACISVRKAGILDGLSDQSAIDDLIKHLSQIKPFEYKNPRRLETLAYLAVMVEDHDLASKCYEAYLEVTEQIDWEFMDDFHAGIVRRVLADFELFKDDPSELKSILLQRNQANARTLGFKI